MKKTTKSKEQNVAESAETMTYLVKGPAPQKGQKASAGGIREKGKLKAQYRDPIPYNDDPPAPNRSNNSGYLENLKHRSIADCLNMVWRDFGKPRFLSLLRRGTNKVIECFNPKPNSQAKNHYDATGKDNRTAVHEKRDNIIQFPQRYVG